MQLKETVAGEVTTWLSEMLITIGGTGKTWSAEMGKLYSLCHRHTNTLNLHCTMSCVLSEELAATPLEAVQVMMANALSLVTLVRLRLLVTLNVAASGVLVLCSSAKSTPFMNQEMVGTGTPVAVHINTSEAPSDTVTVGF